jgi:tryptophanyl-tRNA synthetase
MDLFNDDKDEVEDMKKRYREGNIKDVEVKERLFEVMKEKLAPIRERRKEAEGMKEELLRKAIEGSVKTSSIAKETIAQMKKAMLLEFK